jgi:L-amino acid N-acyltransferase YncA
MMDVIIRRATEDDAVRLAEIYNWYVANTFVTFETEVVPVDEMSRRIREKQQSYDWIVGELGREIVGYACYGPFRARRAYFRTIETTIYLAQGYKGKGFGRKIYSALIESASDRGFRELIGVIALPNPASIALHAGLGFCEAGLLRSVGYKFDEYHDIAFWQRSLKPVERAK